jgi:hypothetical protein
VLGDPQHADVSGPLNVTIDDVLTVVIVDQDGALAALRVWFAAGATCALARAPQDIAQSGMTAPLSRRAPTRCTVLAGTAEVTGFQSGASLIDQRLRASPRSRGITRAASAWGYWLSLVAGTFQTASLKQQARETAEDAQQVEYQKVTRLPPHRVRRQTVTYGWTLRIARLDRTLPDTVFSATARPLTNPSIRLNGVQWHRVESAPKR